MNNNSSGNTNHSISEEQLHLYVDGELSAAETREILQAISSDAAVRQRVSELEHLKAMVKNQYPLEPVQSDGVHEDSGWQRYGIAASLMALAFGVLVGWSVHTLSHRDSQLANNAGASVPLAQAKESSRVLLHIDDDDPAKLQSLVSYAEALLQGDRSKIAKVEVIANGRGVNFLRTGNTPGKTELRNLTSQYSNIELFACAKALSNLKEKGIEVDLMPKVHTRETALEHIVKRMQEGWRYHKI